MEGTPPSSRINEDVDRASELLEIIFRENGAAVEVLDDISGHRRKELVEGENVSWGGA